MRSSFKALAGVLAVASALVAGTAMAADYTLKVASPTNNDAILQWMQSFERRVEAGSDGVIEVELYPANQLGQIPATIEGVSFGTIEVTAPASGFFVNFDPRFEIFDVPGLFDDFAHAQAVLSDPEVLDRIATFGNDKGLAPIAAFPHGPLGLLSRAKVDTLADLDGQKIRIAGPTALNTGPLTSLGASPVSMPLGETLPALQNGTVDGFVAGLPVFTTGKFYDVAKELVVMPESYLIVTAVASQTFLDTIGDDLAELVKTSGREALGDANGWNADFVASLRDVWKDNGGTLVEWNEADTKGYLDAVSATLTRANAENAALDGEVTFFREAAARLAK